MTIDIDYAAYLLSEIWKEKRERVLIFWDHKCALCYSGTKLQVHHRTYERLGREKITDLLPLCENCHQYFHAGRYSQMTPIQVTLDRIVTKITGKTT